MMKRYLYMALFSLVFVACEEVIEIDLNSSAPVVVAEGMIQKDSSVWLSLSYTTDYFTVEEAEQISDAVVSISDDSGNATILESIGGGKYAAPLFTGAVGRTYTMTFEHQGEQYTATSTLMSPTQIKDVTLEKIQMGIREMGAEAYMPTVIITDESEEENYYRFKFYINGEAQDGYAVTTDRSTSDGLLEYTARMAVEAGDTFAIEAFSIDEVTYAYYSQLADQSEDGIGSSTPYNSISNFGTEIMGFFTALSSDAHQLVVPVGE